MDSAGASGRGVSAVASKAGALGVQRPSERGRVRSLKDELCLGGEFLVRAGVPGPVWTVGVRARMESFLDHPGGGACFRVLPRETAAPENE